MNVYCINRRSVSQLIEHHPHPHLTLTREDCFQEINWLRFLAGCSPLIYFRAHIHYTRHLARRWRCYETNDASRKDENPNDILRMIFSHELTVIFAVELFPYHCFCLVWSINMNYFQFSSWIPDENGSYLDNKVVKTSKM